MQLQVCLPKTCFVCGSFWTIFFRSLKKADRLLFHSVFRFCKLFTDYSPHKKDKLITRKIKLDKFSFGWCLFCSVVWTFWNWNATVTCKACISKTETRLATTINQWKQGEVTLYIYISSKFLLWTWRCFICCVSYSVFCPYVLRSPLC